MRVVGRADGHGVDVFLLFQHDAEIGVALCIGVTLEGAAGPVAVDITERDEGGSGAAEILDFPGALTADAYAGQVEPFVRAPDGSRDKRKGE